MAALETRQGRHDTPQAYYSRLRQAYFGTRNESAMEEELNFKTLFLRNLHPGISHHLGILACPRTMNQTLWITVPKGAILHIDELALYHLTDDEYRVEIEISY